MKIFEGFEGAAIPGGAVVTVGSFDGVHRGHRALLQRVALHGPRGVVVTFAPHPREVLDDGVGLLTTLPEKIALLERAGIENLVVAPFTKEFSMLSSREFAERFLVGKLGAKRLVAGYNHRFGHDKARDFEALDGLETEFVAQHGEASSTAIRKLIAAGKMREAAELAGYDYFIMGRAGADGVFTPAGPEKLLPPAGKYATDAGVLTISPEGLSLHPEGLSPTPARSEELCVTFV